MLEYGLAVPLVVLIQCDTRVRAADHFRQHALAVFDRLAAQVVSVDLDQIERTEHSGRTVPAPADQFEYRKTIAVADDCLAIRQAQTGSAETAATIKGNRAVKSVPLRV